MNSKYTLIDKHFSAFVFSLFCVCVYILMKRYSNVSSVSENNEINENEVPKLSVEMNRNEIIIICISCSSIVSINRCNSIKCGQFFDIRSSSI